PAAASAWAWYRILALRPRSPRATTAALTAIEELRIENSELRIREWNSGPIAARPLHFITGSRQRSRPKRRAQQVRSDADAVLGRGSEVVDRGDLPVERTLCLGEGPAAGQRRLGPRQPDHGGRDAAERDARPIAVDGRHHDFRDRLRGARP